MRCWWLAIGAALVVACGQEPGLNGENGTDLPEFDPSAVVFADGCDPMPEARACIEANPVEFLPGDAPQISARCEDLGYTCCNPEDWISRDAASCIAETDARMSDRQANQVTLGCYDDVFGPMFAVYERNDEGRLQGIGIHAATGRVTWFDDGSGVFS
ncbi:MAG: hypothetical protein AAGA48_27840 [Myxococcota bacterium]